jgi:hypothetical protein
LHTVVRKANYDHREKFYQVHRILNNYMPPRLWRGGFLFIPIGLNLHPCFTILLSASKKEAMTGIIIEQQW